MELVPLQKKDVASEKGSEAGDSESVILATTSQSINEVTNIDTKSLDTTDTMPGNLSTAENGSTATLVKTKTVLDDEERQVPGVLSFKNFKKMTQSSEDLRQQKRRFNRNKVGPADINIEPDRPVSAPLNRSRQMLQEINGNRPMTAAPMFMSPQTNQEQRQPENENVEAVVIEEAEPSLQEAPISEVPSKPRVNETAYIPYDYAQAMISRIVSDMHNMKSNHHSIITRMEQQYQRIEEHTQGQFNECISQLQEKHKKRTQHYRHVIEVLHAELKAKGALRSEAIKNLKERNKELALQRRKVQQLSSSQLKIHPPEVDNRESVVAVPLDAERSEDESSETHAAEGKIIEDARETEKELIEDAAEEVAALSEEEVIPVPIILKDELIEKRDAEKEEEQDEEGEEFVKVEEEDETLEEDDVAHDEVELEDDEAEEYEKHIGEESDDERDIDGEVVVAALVAKEGTEAVIKKKQAVSPAKKEGTEKAAKGQKSPEKKQLKSSLRKQPEPSPVVAEPAQRTRQQILLEQKQTKKIKELEKQLDLEHKRLEQVRKNVKNAEDEIEKSKREIADLQKALAQQKAECGKLEEAAGAGTIALQKLPELKQEIKHLTAENQTLVNNYNSERVLRKKYYNMVEDMKGKIRVYCRVRPMSSKELGNNNTCAVQTPDEYTVRIQMNRGGVKEFQFDEIFNETHTQANVFEDTNSLIQSAVDGYNVCIFAYGQTGSGKTYTMIGDNGQTQPGIAPRAFDRIFEIAGKNAKKFSFKISCYMLELYNERLVDLLANSKAEPARLDIKKDNKGMVFIQGTEVISADDSKELFKIFMKGSENRHVASTKMNDDSSRSHLVVGVIIESTNLTSGAITRGKLSLVDLAGSERVGKTGATAQQLKEANSINKSLSALGDVISALSSEQSFIPYRNNKLTLLMQDSLGGNAKTLMFVNISPADYNSDESAISLTYASRVKLITNDATKMADSKEVARLKAVIAKLKAGEAVEE